MKFILLLIASSMLASCSSITRRENMVPVWAKTCSTNWDEIQAEKLECNHTWVQNGRIYARAMTLVESKNKQQSISDLKEFTDRKARFLLQGAEVTVEDNFHFTQIFEATNVNPVIYKTKYYSLVSIPL